MELISVKKNILFSFLRHQNLGGHTGQSLLVYQYENLSGYVTTRNLTRNAVCKIDISEGNQPVRLLTKRWNISIISSMKDGITAVM